MTAMDTVGYVPEHYRHLRVVDGFWALQVREHLLEHGLSEPGLSELMARAIELFGEGNFRGSGVLMGRVYRQAKLLIEQDASRSSDKRQLTVNDRERLEQAVLFGEPVAMHLMSYVMNMRLPS